MNGGLVKITQLGNARAAGSVLLPLDVERGRRIPEAGKS